MEGRTFRAAAPHFVGAESGNSCQPLKAAENPQAATGLVARLCHLGRTIQAEWEPAQRQARRNPAASASSTVPA